MKTRFAPLHFAIFAGALLLGVVLDRLLLAQSGALATVSNRIDRQGDPSRSTAPGASLPDANAAALVEEVQSSTAAATSKPSLEAVLGQRDRQKRIRDLQAFINGLAPNDHGEALKSIRQIANSNERELASRLLIAHWVQSDPDGALQFAAANRGYEYVADDVFQQLAVSDVQSALARAQAIPGNDLRYMALRGVLSFMADSDPPGAIRLAATLGEFRGNEPLNSVIYRQWAANDPQAAALQAAQETSGERWRSPVVQVVNTWAGQDPVSAANWSLSLPPGEAQARSISQVMRQWGRDNPTAAANWINSLPPGAKHDAAVSGLASSLVSIDPQTALGWIGTIADDTARAAATRQISREVMWRDPQNGAAMLQAAGVPADQIPQPRRGRGGR